METPFGKVLASGNGKGNRAIFVNWIATLLAVVFLVVACSFLSYLLQTDSDKHRRQADRVRNLHGYEEQLQAWYEAQVQYNDEKADRLAWHAFLAFWVGIVIAVGGIIGEVFSLRGIAKTEISVYENGITGTGCGMCYQFTWRLHRFQLTYDEITSVSTVDWLLSSSVIIHAPNARYWCYVTNPDEIQLIIGTTKFGDRPTTEPQTLTTPPNLG